MGLFDTLDISSVPEDPDFLPDDVYHVEVVKASSGEVGTGSHLVIRGTDYGVRRGISITMRVLEGNQEGRVINFWGSTHPDDDVRNLSGTVNALVALGISREEIEELDEDELLERLIGVEAYVSTSYQAPNEKRPRGRVNVVKFAPVSALSGADAANLFGGM